jgi:hypothetical protein
MNNALIWLKSYLGREVKEKQTFYIFSIANFANDLKKCLNRYEIDELIKELKK